MRSLFSRYSPNPSAGSPFSSQKSFGPAEQEDRFGEAEQQLMWKQIEIQTFLLRKTVSKIKGAFGFFQVRPPQLH